MTSPENPGAIGQLLDTPDLADALESDLFKQFLDQVPIAIAVSELKPVERVIYANLEFEALSGQAGATIMGAGWDLLLGEAEAPDDRRTLAIAIRDGLDYLGAFSMPHGTGGLMVDAWSNVISDDAGRPAFRLLALVEAARPPSPAEEMAEKVREKDTQLLELQHRVRNNLQMITALIRLEARGVSDLSTGQGFDRLAGRVEALGLLYRALGDSNVEGEVDLGVYLGEIASAVMRAHATEGVHFDLQLDTWTVPLDTAMPTGLVVNELFTNALKHAFAGRDGGTITLQSKTENGGCEVVVADDGVGLPQGYNWPQPGKLSALIVRSLVANAKAKLEVFSSPGRGMKVVITFRRAPSATAA